MQVLVHVRPADAAGKAQFQLLESETYTSIQQIKEQVPSSMNHGSTESKGHDAQQVHDQPYPLSKSEK